MFWTSLAARTACVPRANFQEEKPGDANNADPKTISPTQSDGNETVSILTVRLKRRQLRVATCANSAPASSIEWA